MFRAPFNAPFAPAFGGAVAAAGFDPTTIATQIIDFSALSTLFTDTTRTTPVASDGDTIKGVTDALGGFHMTNATGVTYKANIQNGLSVGRFNGTDQSLRNALIALAQPTTFFVVVKHAATGGDRKMLGGGQAVYTPNTSYQLYAGGFSGLVGTAPTSFGVVVIRFDGASSFGRVNGVQSANTNAGTGALSGLWLGQEGSGVQFLSGDVGELWTCGNVTTDDITAGETYLASKWGIS